MASLPILFQVFNYQVKRLGEKFCLFCTKYLLSTMHQRMLMDLIFYFPFAPS
ncbi:hypothetical protein ABKV19_016953 [Rosa sericea]